MFEENLFENVLKSFRVRKGNAWTQAKTAELLGVSERTYKGWETGERVPSDRYLQSIVELFKLDEADRDTLYLAAARVAPRIHNLPFPQNPFFTGRDRYLKLLGKHFTEGSSVALTQSISGLGGIGKTQLALEYAHRCYQEKGYRAVFWVKDAVDKTTIEAGYLSLAHLLDLPEKNEEKADRIIQAVKRWLERHTNWLLILDNADNLQVARSFFPVEHEGHILLTTRSQIVGNIAKKIEIEEMEPEEGLLFLLKRAGMVQNEADLATVATDVRETALQLVKLLGGLPLALDQAGAYIEETGVSFADYIKLYHEKRRFLLDSRGSLGDEHPATVATTLEISFEWACKKHPLARDILYFCSFLQPDAMPEEVFQQDDGFKLDTTLFDAGITALRRYSLINRNGQEKLFSMHRLVQAVLVDAMASDLQKQWRERVIKVLNAAFPEVEFKEWRQCERLVPHALVCVMSTEAELSSILDASHLFLKAGIYLRDRGQYSEAEALFTKALMVCEQHLGDHLDAARTLHELANLHWLQGKYEQAEPLYLRALSIRERYLGEHPDTANSLRDLAVLYRQQGKYEQSEILYQRALAIQEQHQGDHPDTALSLNNLGVLYWRQGKYEQAEPLYQRALSIYEKHLGEALAAARCLNNLAVLYQHQGKYEQAEPLYQQALTIREQHLGDHPDTAWSLSTLGNFYRQEGKYGMSEPLLERALAIREQQLGAEHPDTAHSLHNLAELYRQQGRYERGETLYERALAIREQQLGAEHPDTARSLHGLAKLMQGQGKHQQAEALYRRTLGVQEQQLGLAHPDTQETRKDYAAFLHSIRV